MTNLEATLPLSTVHCPLSTVNCPLSTVNCLLFTVHCTPPAYAPSMATPRSMRLISGAERTPKRTLTEASTRAETA